VKFYWLLAALLLTLSAHAQLSENFTDGDFTQNPAWTGDAAGFQINAQKQLQSSGPATTGSQLQLVTPCTASIGTTWEFWANLKLATSGSNYADVWLLSAQADVKAAGNTGYFVRLGGTTDEVALFRKDATGNPAYVVNGQDATLNSTTNNLVRVRVTRSVQNVWTLERDLTGGQSFTTEGTATDDKYQLSNYLGVYLLYSSANSKSFYFDDFRVMDATSPTLLNATIRAARQVEVVFNEAVAAAQNAAAYRLAAGAPAVVSAQRDAANPALVHLTLAADAPLGSNVVEVRQVADVFGNVAVGPLTVGFINAGFAVAPGFNQLLITEIMANETPVVGLPGSEYVEVHNPSATAVLDLAGVRLLKPSSTSNPAVFPAGAVLLPGEYAVVCGSTRAGQFAGFGKVFGLTNFPSLTNAGDQLVLRSHAGQTLFEISYSDTWYKDSKKKNGGWALEMVDTANPCASLANWTASQDASGGTPGRANSVRATNPDQTPPALLRALASGPTAVRLFFSEKLDSAAVANTALYTFSPTTTITRATAVAPDFRTVDLMLGAAMQPNQPVTVTVQRTVDCVGNATGAAATATFALPGTAAPGDVVINEILFNPRTYAVDFVELLNRSNKYLDVQGWTLSNQKPDGTLDTKPVTAAPYVLAPHQLVVLTERPDVVQAQYPTSHDAAAFLAVTALPTYPDDAGIVSVSSATGVLLDQYAYDKSQHLALLSDLNGVSLERIRADGPSVAGNFHSAASAVGYATPGRANSQYQDDPGGDKLFRLEPEVFTPDEDGQQDFTTLNYQFDQPGYAVTVTIYDAQGRLTRQLVRNETLPLRGFVPWDGLTDQGRKAPTGAYVLLIELLHPASGERRQFKKTVVVGARL